MKKQFKKVNGKEIESKANPYEFQMHYLSTKEWLEQAFEIQKDEHGHEIIFQDGSIVDDQGITHQCYKYALKRKAEVWMICLTFLINLEFKVRSVAIAKGEESKPFVYYGRYSSLRDTILNFCPAKLRHQLSKSFTVPAISTAMSRMEASGLISIEYNHDVKYKNRNDGEYFRSISINHDKLVELSDFSLDKEERRESKTWKKYSRCSREHKWMRKRVISSFKAIDNQLSTAEKKAEIMQKLARLKIKFKCKQDLFKTFINRMQCSLYSPNVQSKKYMTAIKTKEEESDELLKNMYVHPDIGEITITPAQEEILKGFYERIQ